MTIDEAILHAEEVADKCALTDGNIRCENEHRQLAEWLKDYKRMRENWKQLKETVSEIKGNNKYDHKDVTEICQFLLNYMGVLESIGNRIYELEPIIEADKEQEK